jgi:NADH-quinone oxidoreductase subunit N
VTTSLTTFSLSYSSSDYLLALPLLLLTVFALGILMIDLMLPKQWKRVNAIIALIGVAFSAAAVGKLHLAYHAAEKHGVEIAAFTGFMGSLVVDRFALYFFYLFLLGAAIAILMSMRYLEIEHENHGEFYALLLLSVVGMMGMAAGYDIVLIFISLELMAISTYVLVGFLRRDKRSNEAALKYLLLGAFSSGIFAYGLSLFYGLTGSTNLGQIAQKLQEVLATRPNDPVVIFALLATTTGLLFKIAAVPFHQWAPDAYEGAPTSITGFMSVAVKSAGWAMLLRIFLFGLYPLRPMYVPLLIFVSIATMTGGNLAAITQDNLKRLLAYSSIAHVGYMLLGLIASDGQTNSTGIMAIMIYLLVYTFMNLGAFAVITSLRRCNIIGDTVDDIAGLYFKAPTEATLMLIFLLSLAGIPPLAGFWGKYFIFLSLIQTGHYSLAAVAVLYAVVSMYYYMRIANAMLMRQPIDTEPVHTRPAMRLALTITAAGTVGIGLFPNFFINVANWSLGLVQGTQHMARMLR